MRSLKNKRLKSQTNEMQHETSQKDLESAQDEKTLPFKPFQGKFTNLKQPSMYQFSQKSSICVVDKLNHKDERRICTEVETNDFYQSDFQEYEQSFHLNQTVQQQNQNPISANVPSKQSSFLQSESDQQFYTSRDLNRINLKLIEQIQFFRFALQKYRYNCHLIHKQQKELQNLKDLRQKAVDYSYQLQLDRQVISKSDLSKSHVSTIRQASVMIKKQKYKATKESHRKGNPSTFEQQSLNPQSKLWNKQLCIVREQLLCKKRQFYQHIQSLKELDNKIKFYVEILDQYESRISLNDPLKLLQRKRQLQLDISLKKAAKDQTQMVFELEISNLNNQISAVEISTMKIENQKQQIIKKVRQLEPIKNNSLKNDNQLIHFFGKKSNLEVNSPPSLLKIPKTPRTPKAISRFYYNLQKNRNSSNFYMQNH